MTPQNTTPEPRLKPWPKHWKRSLVLLTAHGSETTPEGAEFVRRQAEALRQRGVFGDVHTTFLRDPPHPRDIITASDYPHIYVVPFMISEGHSIDIVIPEAMALDGPLTELITRTDHKRVYLCRALGTHSTVRMWSRDIISSIITNHGLSPDDTAALVLCHGTTRHQGGRSYAEQVTRDINNSGLVAHTAMLFLEEAPRIDEWRSCVSSRYVIALPYLMTSGRHAAFDIPSILGIDPNSPTFHSNVREGKIAGPFDIGGRKLWYTPLVGTFDRIPDIIIDRVAEWDKST